MTKAIRKSLSKQIAEYIEEKIRSDEYRIGDKLPSEPVLVEKFGVSRNTVREALQSLTHSGLLETRQGDGTYIAAKERLQVEFFNIMNSSASDDVLEVRELLENHIVLLAIRSAADEDIKEIESLLELRNHSKNSIREATEADLNFHIAIAKATHNDIILSIYRYVSEYFNQFIYKKLHEPTKDEREMDRIHEMLFCSIRDRNTELALDCVSRILDS